MMKQPILLTACLLAVVPSLALLAETPAPAVGSPQTGTNAAPQTQIREQGTDEIDLEEIDDSADAAKTARIQSAGKDLGYVDISCDEATLADILRQFRKTTQANIVFDDSTNLQKRVSATLTHVPWMDALQSLLKTRGFRLEQRNGIYFVSEDKQAVPILTKSFILNHASADELAALFNENYGTKDAKGTIVKKVANAFAGANVVVVTAPENVLQDCEEIIKTIDRAVAQIYIEARFLELSSEASHQLGIQWDSLQKVGAGTSKVSIKADKTETDGDETHTTVFTGTLTASDFGLYLSAFEKLGGTQIFSNPKVIVSNGKEAKVDMTTKYPNITVSSQRNTVSGTSYTDYKAQLEEIRGDKEKGLFAGSAFYSWGITLSVKPRISPDGLISVEIVPSISQLDTDITSDGFYKVKGGSNVKEDESDSAYGRYPIIKVKSISTEFSMKDGSTAVIGGLSKTTEEDVDTGIPYLRKCPWIGQKLFGWTSRQKVQKEIVICITIGIADPANLPKDMGLPQNAVLGREFVDQRRLEPGLRTDGADALTALDTKPLADQRSERLSHRGTVTITPSK